MKGFMVRNLKLFFRDKSAVFFSLLAVLIIIGLYALFLGDTMAGTVGDMPGARVLMDSWIVAGLLAVTSVTTTMGAFGRMVEDNVQKISKDFICSPMKRWHLAGGYILSAFIIGCIMSLLAFLLTALYQLLNGGQWPALGVIIQSIGLIFLATFANTSLVLLVITFIRSVNAFATVSTILGTIIGFLTGIYLPIGQLPTAMQWVVKLFPVSHAAVLLRQTLMEQPLSVSFAGTSAETRQAFEETMGVTLTLGSRTITPLMSIGYLCLTAMVLYGLAIVRLAKKKR